MPTYFLFSLKRGIPSGAAAPCIRSFKKIKKRKKAAEKNTPLLGGVFFAKNKLVAAGGA